MFLLRILAILFATDQGFRHYKKRSSSTVTAFTNSRPSSSRISTNKHYTSLGSTKNDEYSEHFLLLDESILLYSRLKTESTDDDVENQRKEELTLLIEDVVLDGSGIVRDEATAVKEVGREAESKEETTAEELDEISRALDEQILLGSQKTFTEEELSVWIANIDSLRDKLQSQLIALPPSSSTTTTTLKSTTPPEAPSIDRFRTRLESMRTSIEPTESSR